MDHHSSNSSNAVGRFARPMESGENIEKPNGNLYFNIKIGLV